MSQPAGRRALPRWILFSPLALLPVLVVGWCVWMLGGKGTVNGKVTLGGTTTVTAGIVIFTGADGVPFSARIDKDGYYTLTKLPLGEMKVSLTNAAPAYEGGAKDPAARPAVPKKLPIPGRYENPDNGLKVVVKSGSQTYNIELKP